MLRMLLALVLTVGVGSAAANAAPAARPALRVALRGQDHHPRVGKPWAYSVTVTTPAGKIPVCRIRVAILFGGVQVGLIGVHTVRNGVWRETIGTGANEPFPSAARGQPLVLQATVTAKGYPTAKARWPIVVR